ncbi:YkoP family protein [Thalassobacillus pellis]|uniref:YkoP family protein n=1 Tax=Thalassobacillus pellis TaxID=748008 RepID=UPI0019606F03|nr:hypothetical protein [Thalassobacillus pellis]MBM7552247.1 hypothetical protein [Thalassobacillus pellis]
MKQYLVDIWTLLDPLYYRMSRLTYVRSKNKINNIFRVKLVAYKGKQRKLADGTLLQKNDQLIKIHLHNIRLINEMRGMKNDIQKARYIYKAVQHSLPDLVSFITSHKRVNEIKGIVGITALNSGCERLGFEIIAIESPFYRSLKLMSFIAISTLCMRPPSLKYLKKHQPKYIYMSRTDLENRYQSKKAEYTM